MMPAATNYDLFSIIQITHGEGSVLSALSINPASNILNGHFPGHPVVPGACMLQIVKEVLESALACSFLLKKADHLKFMSLIEPENNREAQLEIVYREAAEGDVNVNAKLSVGETVCFKLQGSFLRL